MLKCKHQCRCACSSEIGTCIINDTGRQKATKIHVLYSCYEGKYLLTSTQNKNFKQKSQTQRHYTFRVSSH